jgi:hypothetical protein
MSPCDVRGHVLGTASVGDELYKPLEEALLGYIGVIRVFSVTIGPTGYAKQYVS